MLVDEVFFVLHAEEGGQEDVLCIAQVGNRLQHPVLPIVFFVLTSKDVIIDVLYIV